MSKMLVWITGITPPSRPTGLSFCKEYGAMIKWEYIAGEKLGRVSRCERINAGILYVKVYASSWRQEAQYMKEKFLHRIHKDFGCSTIKDIVFY